MTLLALCPIEANLRMISGAWYLLFAAVVELCSMTAVIGATKGSGRAAGDFALDPLEFCGNPETKAFMLEAEITHARLAMLGFSGLVTQSALLEKGFPYF